MAEAKNEKGAKPAKGDKAAAPKGAKGAPAPAEAKGGKGRREGGAEAAAAGAVKAPPKDYVARLKKVYHDEIVPKMVAEFGYKNPMEVPKIDKIVLNMGVG